MVDAGRCLHSTPDRSFTCNLCQTVLFLKRLVSNQSVVYIAAVTNDNIRTHIYIQMWSRKTGWTDAKHCLESNGLEPIKLGAKEGTLT